MRLCSNACVINIWTLRWDREVNVHAKVQVQGERHLGLRLQQGIGKQCVTQGKRRQWWDPQTKSVDPGVRPTYYGAWMPCGGSCWCW